MGDELFIAVPKDDGEDWWICWTGDFGESSWNVTTNHIHGSDVPSLVARPEDCAKLIAKLLNWYYADEKNADIIEKVYKTDF